MEPPEKKIRQLGIYLTIPFVLAVPPIVGWFIGSRLDIFFATTPMLTYVFIILGLFSGFREFYRIIKKYGDTS